MQKLRLSAARAFPTHGPDTESSRGRVTAPVQTVPGGGNVAQVGSLLGLVIAMPAAVFELTQMIQLIAGIKKRSH